MRWVAKTRGGYSETRDDEDIGMMASTTLFGIISSPLLISTRSFRPWPWVGTRDGRSGVRIPVKSILFAVFLARFLAGGLSAEASFSETGLTLSHEPNEEQYRPVSCICQTANDRMRDLSHLTKSKSKAFRKPRTKGWPIMLQHVERSKPRIFGHQVSILEASPS